MAWNSHNTIRLAFGNEILGINSSLILLVLNRDTFRVEHVSPKSGHIVIN